jgi:hypothetical protein
MATSQLFDGRHLPVNGPLFSGADLTAGKTERVYPVVHSSAMTETSITGVRD